MVEQFQARGTLLSRRRRVAFEWRFSCYSRSLCEPTTGSFRGAFRAEVLGNAHERHALKGETRCGGSALNKFLRTAVSFCVARAKSGGVRLFGVGSSESSTVFVASRLFCAPMRSTTIAHGVGYTFDPCRGCTCTFVCGGGRGDSSPKTRVRFKSWSSVLVSPVHFVVIWGGAIRVDVQAV